MLLSESLAPVYLCTSGFCVAPSPFNACALQVMPMYNAEVAPPHLRGAMNILFQWFVTFGILCAGLINYGCDFIDGWGWRLALGLAGML